MSGFDWKVDEEAAWEQLVQVSLFLAMFALIVVGGFVVHRRRSGVAATLSNIGMVHDSLGQLEQSLPCYNRALPIMEEVATGRGWSLSKSYKLGGHLNSNGGSSLLMVACNSNKRAGLVI
jgi:hypothetical protein